MGKVRNLKSINEQLLKTQASFIICLHRNNIVLLPTLIPRGHFHFYFQTLFSVLSSSSDASTYFQIETPSHISIVLNLIAGDKRSPPPILGQRHSFNCIARFFPNLSTFLECPCGRNIVGQQLPTLLDVTCCVRLHILLHVVGCCCVLLGKV